MEEFPPIRSILNSNANSYRPWRSSLLLSFQSPTRSRRRHHRRRWSTSPPIITIRRRTGLNTQETLSHSPMSTQTPLGCSSPFRSMAMSLPNPSISLKSLSLATALTMSSTSPRKTTASMPSMPIATSEPTHNPSGRSIWVPCSATSQHLLLYVSIRRRHHQHPGNRYQHQNDLRRVAMNPGDRIAAAIRSIAYAFMLWMSRPARRSSNRSSSRRVCRGQAMEPMATAMCHSTHRSNSIVRRCCSPPSRGSCPVASQTPRAPSSLRLAHLAIWVPITGWVLGYDADTLKQVAVFNTTPNAVSTDPGGDPIAAGGIWMSGAGLPVTAPASTTSRETAPSIRAPAALATALCACPPPTVSNSPTTLRRSTSR